MRHWFTLAAAIVAGIASGSVGGFPIQTTHAPETRFDELFDQYRRGDADAAVAAFQREWRLGSPKPDPLRYGTADGWTEAAFLLFLTEVGEGAGYSADPIPIAQRLIELSTAERSAGLRDFVRSWAILSGSWHQRGNWQYPDVELHDFVRRHFSGDAEASLFLTSTLAAVLGPVTYGGGWHFHWLVNEAQVQRGFSGPPTRLISSSHGLFDRDRVEQVEAALRRALVLDPTLLEARLRLGRLQLVLDRVDPARDELTRTVDDARALGQPYAGYLGAVFLGQLHERGGRVDLARAAYESAISFMPRAPAAHLALGRLLISHGAEHDGWAAIRRMFGDSPGPAAAEIDPWVSFLNAQYWQHTDRLASLRGRVRLPRADGSAGGHRVPRVLRPSAGVGEQPATRRAQSEQRLEDQGAFRAEVEGVRVDVYVTDDGRPVTGLTAQDFELRDNGVPQTLNAAAAVGHLSVGFVLDQSYSVLDIDRRDLQKAGEAVVSALQPGDVASVVTADDRLTLAARAARAFEEVLRALVPAPRRSTRTAVWDATAAAAAMAMGEGGRPIVIVLSDLADNASWVTQSPAVQDMRVEREAVAEWFRRSGVVVDLISVPPYYAGRRLTAVADIALPQLHTDHWVGHVIGHDTGDHVARPTGGELLKASDSKLAEHYARKFAELRAGYVLTFTPTGVKKGDGWHKLTVRLKDAKGKVQARPGYYSAK